MEKVMEMVKDTDQAKYYAFYVDFVLKIGKKLQDPFQKAMKTLFSGTNKCIFSEAPGWCTYFGY